MNDHIPQEVSSSESLSRRERRELRRMGHRDQQQSENRRRLLRRIAVWGGSIALIVGFGWLMVRLAANVQLPAEGGGLTAAVSEADNISGPASASVTLVEYADFQCPACGSFYPLVKKLAEEPELKGKIRVVYRNFPLPQHKNARLAAAAAQAAALQGKFWEMHDVLFETQTRWSEMSAAGARDVFIGYAKTLGLDVNRLTADIASDAVAKRVQNDVDTGTSANVNATPTFFVNGVRVPSPDSYETFKQFIISHATP